MPGVSEGNDAARRDEVLDVTVRLIIERGVNAIRLADVAESAGTSVGLITHHFRNRDGLLVAAFRHEAARIAATPPVVDGDETPLQRLVHYVWLRTPAGSRSAATAFPVWSFWLDFWALACHQPDVRAQFAPIYETVTAPLRAALEDGIAAGDFSPTGRVPDIAYRITAMIDGLALRTLLGDIPPGEMPALLVEGLGRELQLTPAQTRRARRIARGLDAPGD
jgi:AcrR family transcriptional regulator